MIDPIIAVCLTVAFVVGIVTLGWVVNTPPRATEPVGAALLREIRANQLMWMVTERTTTTHPDTETLSRALDLACRRLADSGQSYEEADTAEGWRERLIEEAKRETVK